MIGAEADSNLGRVTCLRLIVTFIAVVICAAGLVFAPRSSAASCSSTTVVHDYLAPLDHLPRVPSLEWPDKKLPFGPAGLSLIKNSEIQRTRPLVVQGDEGPKSRPLGFSLVNESPKRPGKLQLNWTVKSQLRRFSAGKRQTLGIKTKHITDLASDSRSQFLFPIPTKPGSYLVEIEFRNRGGQRLGRLGDYLRVVPARQETQISLSSTALKPTETLGACLENLGTESVDYGEGFLIEVFSGSTWTRSPISPSSAVSAIGLKRDPGEAAPLNSFTIPADAPPGQYRYVWNGTLASSASLTLAPEFQILSSSG